MGNTSSFEIYGGPDDTKRAFVRSIEALPPLLTSKLRSTLSHLVERPRLCIGEEGKRYKAHDLTHFRKVEGLVDGPEVTDASIYLRYSPPSSRRKGSMVFLHWQRDTSCYPRVDGISQLDMTLCCEGEDDAVRIGSKQFLFLMKAWQFLISESRPDYGVFRKGGDQFVQSHVFLICKPDHIYQANYFGPKMVDKLGKERLLGIPKLVRDRGKREFPARWVAKWMPAKGILLYEGSDPSKPGIAGDMEQLKRYLGIKDLNVLSI